MLKEIIPYLSNSAVYQMALRREIGSFWPIQGRVYIPEAEVARKIQEGWREAK